MSICTHLFDLLSPQPAPDSPTGALKSTSSLQNSYLGCFWGTSPRMSSTVQSVTHLTSSLLRGLGVWQGPHLPHPCLKLPSPHNTAWGLAGTAWSPTFSFARGQGRERHGGQRSCSRSHSKWVAELRQKARWGWAGVFTCSFLPEVTGGREEQRPETTASGIHFC